MQPKDLMLQLLAKKDDPFSGGRTYYSHPSLRDEDKPKIPHQSSATGMQAIPATGAALGISLSQESIKSPFQRRGFKIPPSGVRGPGLLSSAPSAMPQSPKAKSLKLFKWQL